MYPGETFEALNFFKLWKLFKLALTKKLINLML